MEIVVNCNDDTILIKLNKTDEVQMQCKRPYETAKILEEIFNRLANQISGIELTLIDEDNRHSLGEW